MMHLCTTEKYMTPREKCLEDEFSKDAICENEIVLQRLFDEDLCFRANSGLHISLEAQYQRFYKAGQSQDG
jgi:hypothetical protein